MNKHIWRVAGFALLFSLAVAGLSCGDQSGSTTTARGAVTVTEKDSGSTIELVQGQSLIVRLAANSTTGYSWSQVDAGAGVMTATGDPVYEQDQTGGNPPPIGAGGTEIWTYSASASGEQDLRLEYKRSWEAGVAPAETVSYHITVR